MSAPLREGSRLDDLKPLDAGLLHQAEIRTDRFVLRPLRASDAGMIAHYTADKRVAEGTRAIPHPPYCVHSDHCPAPNRSSTGADRHGRETSVKTTRPDAGAPRRVPRRNPAPADFGRRSVPTRAHEAKHDWTETRSAASGVHFAV